MKLALTILFCMVAVTASASPFLVSTNPQPTATEYRLSGGPEWLPSVVQGNTLQVDLGTYYEGTWAIKAKACNGMWCGPEADYTLTCPKPLEAPVLTIEP